MSEQEPNLEQMIAAAKLAIENYLAHPEDDLAQADQLLEPIGLVIMNSGLDEAQKSKVLMDLSRQYRLHRQTFSLARTDRQRSDAARILRLGFKRYLDTLDNYKRKE